ncbi:hypothetical protein I6N90_06910 [Paenibacillus sp. GSMTC-2017]|uniref:hypothetical protein n=1 Tax=Paenibacillus sp. GSMTC-2017 TaxID=2794350 RepID=UPI0018D6323F|nr:hypothetical protein [Paenibacillus sp. GSMTC-2017]MBH5317546.1 hypothetical protein [Paenibacillus sp. GSMTC-2017]
MKTPPRWQCEEPGYYITLPNCHELTSYGEIIMDEIIEHFTEERSKTNEDGYAWIIVDIQELQYDFHEFYKFLIKMDEYRKQGFHIDTTF